MRENKHYEELLEKLEKLYFLHCQGYISDGSKAIPEYLKYKINSKDKEAENEAFELSHQDEWLKILNDINAHIIQDTDAKTFELIKHLLGRKWRANLETLAILINGYKFITQVKRISCVTIARTSKRNLMMFGNDERIRKARSLAVKVGLAYLYDSSYRFNAAKKSDNKAQRFIWNKSIEHILSKLIKTEKIFTRGFIVKNNSDIEKEIATAERLLEEHPDLQFDYIMRLNPLIDGKYYCSDDVITKALKLKYKQLTHYQKLADKMNERLPAQDNIIFRPSISRTTSKRDMKSKKIELVTKIGIRAYNDVCSMKNPDNELEEYIQLETGTDDVLYGKDSAKDSDYVSYLAKRLNVDDDVREMSDIDRKYYLKHRFGTDNYFEYDVPSSIYRVTYALNNNGYWLNDDIDLYDEWCGEGGFRDGGRKLFKNMAMRFYFSPSIHYFWAKTKHIFLKGGAVRGDSPDKVKFIVREKWIPRMFERMSGTFGFSFGSEIFFHESCIYLEAQNRLMKSGADVSLCYDCFYWHYKKGKKVVYTPENIHELLAECARDYYIKWIEPNIKMYEPIIRTKNYIEKAISQDGLECSKLICYPELVKRYGDKFYQAAKEAAERDEKEENI